MEPKSPPSLRILQFVSLVLGDPDSLEAINTKLVMDRGIVAVKENNSLYMLRREAVDAPSGTTIVAPSAGPGRWFLYAAGGSGGGLPAGGTLYETSEGPINFGDTTTFARGTPTQTALAVTSGDWALPDSADATIVYS